MNKKSWVIAAIMAVVGVIVVVLTLNWWLDSEYATGAPQTQSETSPAPSADSEAINTEAQTRDDFNTFMLHYQPRSMCRPENFFRQCYLVTEEICLTTARKVVEECLNIQAEKMGEVIKSGDDVRYWQNMTGRCSGKFYNRELGEYLKEVDNCLQ